MANFQSVLSSLANVANQQLSQNQSLTVSSANANAIATFTRANANTLAAASSPYIKTNGLCDLLDVDCENTQIVQQVSS
jgi:hypothetical protein